MWNRSPEDSAHKKEIPTGIIMVMPSCSLRTVNHWIKIPYNDIRELCPLFSMKTTLMLLYLIKSENNIKYAYGFIRLPTITSSTCLRKRLPVLGTTYAERSAANAIMQLCASGVTINIGQLPFKYMDVSIPQRQYSDEKLRNDATWIKLFVEELNKSQTIIAGGAPAVIQTQDKINKD